MKKIINGKEYDTETSEYLGDFVDYHKNWRGMEDLYRTKNGEYFMHYRRGYGDNEIIPLSEDEACQWTGHNVALLTERERDDEWFQKGEAR